MNKYNFIYKQNLYKIKANIPKNYLYKTQLYTFSSQTQEDNVKNNQRSNIPLPNLLTKLTYKYFNYKFPSKFEDIYLNTKKSHMSNHNHYIEIFKKETKQPNPIYLNPLENRPLLYRENITINSNLVEINKIGIILNSLLIFSSIYFNLISYPLLFTLLTFSFVDISAYTIKSNQKMKTAIEISLFNSQTLKVIFKDNRVKYILIKDFFNFDIKLQEEEFNNNEDDDQGDEKINVEKENLIKDMKNDYNKKKNMFIQKEDKFNKTMNPLKFKKRVIFEYIDENLKGDNKKDLIVVYVYDLNVKDLLSKDHPLVPSFIDLELLVYLGKPNVKEYIINK